MEYHIEELDALIYLCDVCEQKPIVFSRLTSNKEEDLCTPYNYKCTVCGAKYSFNKKYGGKDLWPSDLYKYLPNIAQAFTNTEGYKELIELEGSSKKIKGRRLVHLASECDEDNNALWGFSEYDDPEMLSVSYDLSSIRLFNLGEQHSLIRAIQELKANKKWEKLSAFTQNHAIRALGLFYYDLKMLPDSVAIEKQTVVFYWPLNVWSYIKATLNEEDPPFRAFHVTLGEVPWNTKRVKTIACEMLDDDLVHAINRIREFIKLPSVVEKQHLSKAELLSSVHPFTNEDFSKNLYAWANKYYEDDMIVMSSVENYSANSIFIVKPEKIMFHMQGYSILEILLKGSDAKCRNFPAGKDVTNDFWQQYMKKGLKSLFKL